MGKTLLVLPNEFRHPNTTPPVMFHIHNGVMKADRLLAILLRLDTERRVTAKELARVLEVSPRTISRDFEALSAAGVPVVAERGGGGGWFLLEPYRNHVDGLSASEAQSLFLHLPAKLLKPLGFAQDAATGRAKLHASLSDQSRSQVEWMQSRVLVDTPDWQHSADNVQSLPTLQQALWQGRHVRFVYRKMTGETSERQLDPYGLVLRNGRWYLIGVAADSVRTFRVDRIENVTVLDQSSNRPENFDLEEHWTQSRQDYLQALPRYLVTLLVHERDVPELTFGVRFCTVEHQVLANDRGADWWRVRLAFDTPGVAIAFVLGFGGRVKVEEPKEVRVAVLQAAEQMLALYQQDLNAACSQSEKLLRD
jgi:predicted DNA-binding transcriptional regulator YafY